MVSPTGTWTPFAVGASSVAAMPFLELRTSSIQLWTSFKARIGSFFRVSRNPWISAGEKVDSGNLTAKLDAMALRDRVPKMFLNDGEASMPGCVV